MSEQNKPGLFGGFLMILGLFAPYVFVTGLIAFAIDKFVQVVTIGSKAKLEKIVDDKLERELLELKLEIEKLKSR